MPWYWILIIISAIVGPFEAMHALNKARRMREQRMREEKADEQDDRKPADGSEADPDHG